MAGLSTYKKKIFPPGHSPGGRSADQLTKQFGPRLHNMTLGLLEQKINKVSLSVQKIYIVYIY